LVVQQTNKTTRPNHRQGKIDAVMPSAGYMEGHHCHAKHKPMQLNELWNRRK